MDRGPRTRPEVRERRAGEPHSRALAAMASAASRARESSNASEWTDGDEETGSRRLIARSTTSAPPRNVTRTSPARSGGGPAGTRAPAHRPVADGTAGRDEWGTRWRLGRSWLDDRRMRSVLVTVTIGVLVLAVVGLALGLALRTTPSKTTPSKTTGGRSGAGGAGHTTGTGGHTTGTASGTTPGVSDQHPRSTSHATAPKKKTSTSTTTAPAPAGAAPHLLSVSPASGAAGETVVVHGSGLFSGNGQVLAYFNGRDAPTSCATQSSCSVTVPDLGALPSAMHLTVVTASGTSNALTFSYR